MRKREKGKAAKGEEGTKVLSHHTHREKESRFFLATLFRCPKERTVGTEIHYFLVTLFPCKEEKVGQPTGTLPPTVAHLHRTDRPKKKKWNCAALYSSRTVRQCDGGPRRCAFVPLGRVSQSLLLGCDVRLPRRLYFLSFLGPCSSPFVSFPRSLSLSLSLSSHCPSFPFPSLLP